ncbi:hypothetical protein BTUL_0149g00410 [Botrytis tulipae]|uniref:Uncharacterized protein n=1 Tax=Botrytis tulipae TaxID=87230 RepID=A0A4Z1EGT0_9HELO|nr:hypothetical protein BTUL_0149g00410 [Botrytis tulipae]
MLSCTRSHSKDLEKKLATLGSILAEDHDAELPEKKRRIEKAVTKVLSEGLDRDWVMVKDIQEEGWVLVERESR